MKTWIATALLACAAAAAQPALADDALFQALGGKPGLEAAMGDFVDRLKADPKIGSFFVDERLMVAGMGGLVWMGIGAFIMAKMVSFEI